MDINKILAKNYNKLSQNEIRIIKKVIDRRENFEKLNSEEIASYFNISRSTFLRILRKLSIQSFSDFKFLLNFYKEDENLVFPKFDKICSDYCKSLDSLSKLDLSKIVNLIYKANNIYIYGTGNEQKNIAYYFKESLIENGKTVIDLFDHGEIRHLKKNFTKKDLFILISLSGENNEAIDILKNINNLIRCISITKLKYNSISSLSDDILYVYTKEYSIINNESYELISLFYCLIDLIILKYRKILEEKCL